MFDCREHHTRAHERGGVTAVRHRLDRRRNLEAAEIRPTKDVSSVRRCGDEPDMNRDSSVQSDSVSINGTPDTGYVFRRTDLGGFEIPATVESVAHCGYATTLMRTGVMLSTVEHL